MPHRGAPPVQLFPARAGFWIHHPSRALSAARMKFWRANCWGMFGSKAAPEIVIARPRVRLYRSASEGVRAYRVRVGPEWSGVGANDAGGGCGGAGAAAGVRVAAGLRGGYGGGYTAW